MGLGKMLTKSKFYACTIVYLVFFPCLHIYVVDKAKKHASSNWKLVLHIYNQLVGEFKPFGCCFSIQLFLSRISSFDFLHPCYFSSMLFPKVWWGIRGEGAFPFPIPPKLKGQFAFAQGYSVRWKWKLKEKMYQIT